MLNVTIGKKGSLFDYLDLMPMIFAGCLITLAGIFLINEVIDAGVFTMTDSAETAAIGSQLGDQTLKTFDLVLVAAFIGLFLGSIVLTFSLPSNPMFFWLNVALLTIVIILSVSLSNVYGELTADSVFASTAAELPITNFIFNKLPMITTIYAIVLIVVMLAIKKRESSEIVEI